MKIHARRRPQESSKYKAVSFGQMREQAGPEVLTALKLQGFIPLYVSGVLDHGQGDL